MRPMHKIFQLIADNRAAPRNFDIQQQDDGLHVYIYDVIGDPWMGVDAQALAKELGAFKGSTITAHINSPGGDAFDGRAIASVLAAHPADVISRIEGLAASAASTVAIAGSDLVEMAPGSMLMIHEGWTFMPGNKRDFRAVADMLEKLDGLIADDFAARSGTDVAEVMAWLEAETWFTPEEAAEAKLIDEVGGKAAPKNVWNLSAYRNAPAPQEPEAPEAEPEHVIAARQHHEHLERRIALLVPKAA